MQSKHIANSSGDFQQLSKTRTAQWKPRHPLLNWASSPLDPILHPSPWRLRLLGVGTMLGHPLFCWVWVSVYPQAYESIWMRALMSALATVVLPQINRHLSAIKTQVLFSVIVWLEFPFFFSLMYFSNGGNTVWLASVCAMILIYYHLTDWRIATVGALTGALAALLVFCWLIDPAADLGTTAHATNAVVIAFSWGCALLLGLSSADLRREHLSHTLATMGIMAHELRTPLSTAALLGDAIQIEIRRQPDNPRAPHIEKLALKLHALVRNMNHQIDTQIANAKLRELPHQTERVSATRLVTDVVANYPYLTSRQRSCVKVVILDEFAFKSSSRQFAQVLDNLIKNAFHSLMAADSRYQMGALRITVTASQSSGKILVEDEGMGIRPDMLQQIFKPFFSSNRGTGHGLGLAFCQRVVQSAGGTISVKSEFAVGATFTIELPITT
jgi:two-component system, CAI-1 autoinducer sensor kinase/phosphatase CqsS